MPTYPVEERSLVSSARKPVPACTVAVTASIRPDGDTSRVRLTAAYVTALERAGLIPLIVPPLSSDDAAASVLDSVAGLVLTGGEDVDPARCQMLLPVILNGGFASISMRVTRSPLQVTGRLFRF